MSPLHRPSLRPTPVSPSNANRKLQHCPFIGTVLVAAMLVWNFVFTVANIIRGLVPAVTLFPAVIYAFAALTVTVFFYASYRAQS